MLVPLGRLRLPSLGGQQASFNFFITQCPYRAALINRPSAVNETVVCGVAPTKPRQVPILLRGCQWWNQLCRESMSTQPGFDGGKVRRCSESCRRMFIPWFCSLWRYVACVVQSARWTTVGLLGAGSAERYITSPGGLHDASHKQTFSQQVRRAYLCFWSACVSFGNYFQIEISRYSKGNLEKISWYPQRGLTNFHLDVKQTERLLLLQKQEPGWTRQDSVGLI